MSTCYEVNYRNMWPSELLNHRIGEGAAALHEAEQCSAWFDRSASDDRLALRIAVTAHGTPHEARCSFDARQTHADVCEAIDALFRELRGELEHETPRAA